MDIKNTSSESPNWSMTTRWVVAIIVLVVLIWLLIVALPLVEAIFIGALLAYLIDPLVRFMISRAHIKRSLATILVFSLVLIVLLSLPAALGALAYGQFRNFGVYLNEAVKELQTWISRPIYILGLQLSPQLLVDNIDQSIGGVLTLIPGGSFNILSGLTTNLLWGLVILFSLYYFLKDGPEIKPGLVSLFPVDFQPDASRLLNEIDQTWSVFLRVQLFIFLILAVLLVAGSLLVVILYQAGLIPYSWIGLIGMLIIVYALIQQVDNLWLRPQLLGQRLRLHPAVVVLGLIGALVLSGVLGAIIVVPMIATAKLVGIYLHRKLLGLPPWPPTGDAEISQQVNGEGSPEYGPEEISETGDQAQIK
jgi:predicted PurR-regulated permease PerM